MKIFHKLREIISFVPKKALVAFGIVAAVSVPLAVGAWGPERPTTAYPTPSDHITFNSMTGNPDFGDERNFVHICGVGSDGHTATCNQPGSTTKWGDEITIENGKEYYVRLYVHNNAADNLNLVAQNVRANVNVPTYRANRIQVDGYLRSSNATPNVVLDQAVFKSDKQFRLEYVTGSAKYTNNIFTNGIALPDSIVTETGALLGYDAMNGKIPGCFKYSGWATFKVKAIVADFDIQKTVRIKGDTDRSFKENVNVQPGATVEFLIYFKNTGGEQLKDVIIKDTLPAGLTYVPGSTQLATSVGEGKIPDGITGGGINIGGFVGGGDAYILFEAKVANNNALPKCGVNVLQNIARATTAVGAEEDPATVTVNKTCEPQPVYTCNALTVTKIERTKFNFSTAYTVENVTFKNVTYIIRDESGKEIDRKVVTNANTAYEYVRTVAGKYSVEAVLTVTQNGTDKTATSASCKKEFTVDQVVVPVYTCDVLHIARIERTKFNLTTSYTVENAEYEKVTYTINGNNYTVTNPNTQFTYTQNKPGTYNVQAYITVKTTAGSKTSNLCSGSFTIEPEEVDPEYICKALVADRNRISKGGNVKFTIIPEFRGKVSVKSTSVDFGDGSKTDPSLKTGYIHQYDKAGTFTAKAYINFTVDGKDVNNVSSVECEETITVTTPPPVEKCRVKGKEHLDINDPNCFVYVPTELPQTGGEILGLIGLGGLTTSVSYYINSRRKLRQM